MRNKKADDKTENITTLNAGPIAEEKLEPVEAQDAAAATEVRTALRDDDPVEGPQAKWYVVIKGGVAQCNGVRARLKEGKELNDLNYSIRDLQRQGIRLAKIDPNNRDEPIDALLA
jgi:hypothetical protein